MTAEPGPVAPDAGASVLDLGRRFDAVVLASHLVNVPDRRIRRSLLDTAARHVERSGRVYVEHYDPAAGTLLDREGALGPVHVSFEVLGRAGRRFSARATYRLDDQQWEQTFAAEILDEGALDRELGGSGLRRLARLTSTWLVAARR